MNIFKNNRGEMTNEQIIILILVIFSFAVILFFLLRVNFGSKNQENICYNSVVMRANSPVDIPLDCKREYVCLTADNTCEKMTSPTKEKVKSKEDVYRALSEYSATCWWMFGEGKLNYLSKEYKPRLHCSICYQIGFDNSLKKEIFPEGKIDRNEFYQYMAKTKISDKDYTYAEYLFEDFDFEDFSKQENKEIDLEEIYFIMMGSHSEVSTLGWVVGGSLVTATGVVVGVLTGGVGLAVGWAAVKIAVVAGGAAGYGSSLLIPLIEGKSENDFLPPFLVEANSEEFKALNCVDVETKS